MDFNSFSFTVTGSPISVNKLYYNRGRRARILSDTGKRFKFSVEHFAKSAMKNDKIIETPVTVFVRFFFKTRAGDVDNCLKAVLDALTGVVWKDDRQVADNGEKGRHGSGIRFRLVAEKWKDAKNPRTEIEIHYQLKAKGSRNDTAQHIRTKSK